MSFGDVGHVLTRQSGIYGENWVCVSNTNGFVYARNNVSGQNEIKYDGTNWVDADASTSPTHFGTSLTDSTTIVPDGSATDLYLYDSNAQPQFAFVVHLVNPDPVTSSGPGTLSTMDTASFAGTTPQQIQWSITTGISPTPNSSYYLFNQTPGGSAFDQINLGSNPQAGVTTTETYVNTSGADFTGKWYIGYGQDATRVNLKVYNFTPSKRVFRNFW